jgi:hypothetical protein
VIGADLGQRVFDRDAKQIATNDKYASAAWDDADHVWVLEEHNKLSRWTLSTNQLAEVAKVPESTAFGSVGSHIMLGTEAGDLLVLGRDGKEQRKVALGGSSVSAFNASKDGRWVVVQLSNGGAAIVDTKTWTLERTLAPGDANGDIPVFDDAGELLLRANRYALTIWDRTTGEEIVSGLDLLADLGGGRFLPDGRIETNRRRPGLLDIPRDARPVPEILSDIACHVPLKVVGSRIEPSTPIACASGVSGRTLPR